MWGLGFGFGAAEFRVSSLRDAGAIFQGKRVGLRDLVGFLDFAGVLLGWSAFGEGAGA